MEKQAMSFFIQYNLYLINFEKESFFFKNL